MASFNATVDSHLTLLVNADAGHLSPPNDIRCRHADLSLADTGERNFAYDNGHAGGA